MAFKCDDFGHVIVLTYGQRRLDSVSAPEFREQAYECVRSDCAVYVLDLSGVTFVDSSGIGAIVALLKHLGRNRRLELCGLNPMVRKVFKLTCLDKVFIIRKNTAACLEIHKPRLGAIS